MKKGIMAAFAAAALFAHTAAISQLAPQPPEASVAVDARENGPTINRYIFAQFAEHLGAGIYGGIWVGPDSKIPNTRGFRNDVVAALRDLQVPMVRWPGGCFADTYHWRDGIGPRAKRPSRLNTYWNVLEPNTFGTHEFMDFLSLIGADAFISANVGSAPPEEMASWLEYLTAKRGSLAEERGRNGRAAPWTIAAWGIGNELWGCGGQMRAEYAADLTRRYGQFVKVPEGAKPMVIASGANIDDYAWTETMMREAGSRIDGLSLHYYTIPDRKGARGSATSFDEAAYARTLFKTLRMDELITKHAAIMDKYDPAKRVSLAVDEWGILTDVEAGSTKESLLQQNSLRDALLAALNFNIFIKHADRVRLTAIAQMINVAQSMILTRGAKMLLTPTYFTYKLYTPFQDATLIPVSINGGQYTKDEWGMASLSVVAARGKDQKVHIALVNVDYSRTIRVPIALKGIKPNAVSGKILDAKGGVTAHNTFEAPNSVLSAPFDATQITAEGLMVTMPPHSLVVLDIN